MGEAGRRGTERGEDLELNRRVGDMVLAADDLGDAELGIVHDAGEGIERLAVLADEHRIGKRGGVDMTGAAHAVVPGDHLPRELESPMRTAALRLELRSILRREPQRRTIIDRRCASLKLTLAAPVELLGGLVARIEQRFALQHLRGRRIMVEPVRLAQNLVRADAEPGEILDDGALIFGLRALAIRVVEPQEISPAALSTR